MPIKYEIIGMQSQIQLWELTKKPLTDSQNKKQFGQFVKTLHQHHKFNASNLSERVLIISILIYVLQCQHIRFTTIIELSLLIFLAEMSIVLNKINLYEFIILISSLFIFRQIFMHFYLYQYLKTLIFLFGCCLHILDNKFPNYWLGIGLTTFENISILKLGIIIKFAISYRPKPDPIVPLYQAIIIHLVVLFAEGKFTHLCASGLGLIIVEFFLWLEDNLKIWKKKHSKLCRVVQIEEYH